jgi:hypothetical protein
MSMPKSEIVIQEPEVPPEPVHLMLALFVDHAYSTFHTFQTIKAKASGDLLSPGPGPASQSSMGQFLGRGDLDQAIRSMREGKRRARQTFRPLSKIFLDGAPPGGRPTSRMYD